MADDTKDIEALLERLPFFSVFVTSREKAKHPEGSQLFEDTCRAATKAIGILRSQEQKIEQLVVENNELRATCHDFDDSSAKLQKALALAQSMILGGEEMSPTAQGLFDDAFDTKASQDPRHGPPRPPKLTDVRCCACGEPVCCSRGHRDGLMDVGEDDD